VLANGLPAAPADLKGRLAYVPQHEALLPTLTARETLQYYAQLTLPDAVSPAELRARVEEVLLLMGLSKQGATLVSEGRWVLVWLTTCPSA
jgi:ABC-type multidrug transport system ATPase subunit